MVFCILPFVMLLLYHLACNHHNDMMLLQKSTVIEQQQIVISDREARIATLNATNIALEAEKGMTGQFEQRASDLENVQRALNETKLTLTMTRDELTEYKEAEIRDLNYRDVIQSKDEEILRLQQQLNAIQVDAERRDIRDPQKDAHEPLRDFGIRLLLLAMCCLCCIQYILLVRRERARRREQLRELERQKRERLERERLEGERRDAHRRDAERRREADAERREAERREADLEQREADLERREADRRREEQRETGRREAERREAERREAERREAQEDWRRARIQAEERRYRLGASAQTINRMPTEIYRERLHLNLSPNDERKTCCFCQEPFEEGNKLRRLPCLHFFHKQEIDEWLRRNAKCPICRNRVEEHPDDHHRAMYFRSWSFV